ncbi:MAG: acetyl-CoA carboxylase biotin carboxylase subunit [Frankia sp.]
MIKKVLIANRGEIALRIARTCRELGIGTVAAHSAADRDSAVVHFADRSIQIGPGPAKSSYLFIPAIIEAAKATGADAIHPGYGFLSENEDFAEICESENITFIGTPAAVLGRLGDKAKARAVMTDAGLPLLPGSRDALDGARAAALADRIGYPVIMKAVAGGGGRGMSVVRDPADFAEAWELTQSTAQAVFRDERLYVERYLDSVRHVEIQILADSHGNAVHLGSRDCSVQRRRQKLVEESPAPRLPADMLADMGAAAVRGALAAGYVGAGTFEFLVDSDSRFYFMEVNCRLQVEHPVTEMVTGVDLVAEQLRIAAGEPLSFDQSDVHLNGVSIECRINAEDPARDFVPAAGLLTECQLPAGPFVRVDTHVYPGYRVPPFYDSLLAKVIVWAPTRDAAIARMCRALGETRISGPGVETTTSFLTGVMEHGQFRAAEHDTAFLESFTLV